MSPVVEIDEWWLPYIEDWGIPDWRNESAYPKRNETSMRSWAWEFLRRNPDYRWTWQEVAAPRDGLPPSPYHDDPARYGLRAFLDPRRSNAKPCFLSRRPGTVLHFGPGKFSCRACDAAIIVDLTRPIGPQLATAATKLKNRAQAPQHQSRLRSDMFVKYLRVLDAVDELRTFDTRGRERVSISAIGRVLAANCNDPKSRSIYVQRWREEAESLLWRGYWRIAVSDK